jgi:hypothetical protein
MMRKVDYPFEACNYCENIEDCPHPDADLDGSGICVPIPPEVCPRPLKIALTKRNKKDGISRNIQPSNRSRPSE